jgi:PKD repeat protein
MGPAADTDGNIYVTTGNGLLDKNTGGVDLGDSLIKLSVSNGTLVVADWFSPHDQVNMYTNDLDLGAGAPVVIPSTNLLVFMGKTGEAYLINRQHLGGFVNFSSDTNIVQEFSAATTPYSIGQGPVYWNGPTNEFIYFWVGKTGLQEFSFNGSKITTNPVALGSTTQPGRVGGISLSANGNTPGSGIIWGTEASGGGTVHAYDATNVGNELWNSQQIPARDALGSYTKFCAPTIANGKVYVTTTSSNLVVYGLLGGNTPNLGVSPASHNFGSLATGTTAQTSFVVTNTGGGTLTGTVATAGPFAIVSGGSYTVVSGGSSNVVVSFTPSTPGSFTNSVIFTSNGGVSTNPVTGTGLIPPYLSVSPGSLNYGSLVIGQTSNQFFSVINTGQVTLTGTATVGLPFTAASNASYTVAGGTTGLVLISFSPSTTDAVTSNVVFTSTGGVSTNPVTGTGLTPPNLMVNPGSLNFGTIATGTTAQATFVVTNSGGAVLSGTAVAGGAFTISSGSPYNIPGFGTATVVINFTPLSVGSFTTNVVFASNGGNSTDAVTGSGAAFPSALFGANPTSGAMPLVVTFTDTSTGTITNRFWSFGDGGTTNTLSTTVAHTYNSAGTNTVTLVVTGPLGVSTNTQVGYIIVGNVPPQQVVSPGSRDFGLLTAGQSSTQTFSVANTGGQTLTGTATASGAPFAVVGGSPFNVNSGQTGLVSVSFSPVASGVFTGSVAFTSNGGASTNAVTGSAAVAPTAGFSGTPTTGLVPLAVTFTDSSTGTITNRSWAFGDGGMTNTLNTTVAYTYNSPGTDTVTLVVTGPLGVSTNSRVNYIIATNGVPPTAGFSGTPTNGAATLAVNFTDASMGSITNRSWTFGDGGVSALTSPSHSYTNAGSFSVSLTVLGPFGSNTLSLANYITVTNVTTAPPLSAFTASPTNGAATLLVNFTDTSSGTVTGRVWSFGDGDASTLANPGHPYTNAGVFSVGLTVFGPLGSNSLTLPNYITVTNLIGAPVAGFSASPTNGAAALLVSFTDASMGSITNRSWTFGDGGVSALANPTHTYSNAAIYSVALTVSGPGGSSATNFVNLITVTNLVGTAPTVIIVRPANGMLYPPVTNLTITLVASATANDGSTISKIEFFADGAKLGETTSNPGTNLLVNPTLGSHAITGRATDTLGATNISPITTITVGARNSPLGNWEVTINGADRGADFLTFQDDFSASGFGIRLKTFGLDDVSGRWGFNSKGQVTGPFVEQTDGTTNWTGTLLGPVRSLKSLRGVVPTASSGNFHWRGIPTTTFPDLSGTWTGLVTVVRTTPVVVSYVFSANTNDPAVFDIATSADPGTIVGQMVVTSRNRVYGYVTFNGTSVTMSGLLNVRRLTMNLNGKDSTGERVRFRIMQ